MDRQEAREQLTDTELQALNYDLFITLNVKTEWRSYPDQTARLARKAERIEQAKKPKRKTAPKKKKPEDSPAE